MNINTQHWSIVTKADGLTHLLSGDGTIIGTFTDWQVAEKVLDMRNEIVCLTEDNEAMELKCEELDDELKLTKEDVTDLEDKIEIYKQSVSDLQGEIDALNSNR